MKECHLSWNRNVTEVLSGIYLDTSTSLEFFQMKASRPEEVKFKKTQLVIKSRTPHAGLMLARINFILEMLFYCSVSHYILV